VGTGAPAPAATKLGGATPTIVPLSLLGTGRAPAPTPPDVGPASGAGGGGVAPAGAAGAAGAGAAGALTPGIAGAWFIMSIVPLNFGAAAAFSAKLHLEHVWAVSAF
jgi:hypothetical protein